MSGRHRPPNEGPTAEQVAVILGLSLVLGVLIGSAIVLIVDARTF